MLVLASHPRLRELINRIGRTPRLQTGRYLESTVEEHYLYLLPLFVIGAAGNTQLVNDQVRAQVIRAI